MGVEINIANGQRSVTSDLQHYPQTQRVIYWDRLSAPRPGVNPEAVPDRLQMGPEWQLASDEQFVGRMHGSGKTCIRCAWRGFVRTSVNPGH